MNEPICHKREPEPSEPQIRTWLDRLDKSLLLAFERLHSLESQLFPCLTEEHLPDPCSTRTEEKNLVPIAHRLRLFTTVAEELAERLHNIEKRCEL